MRSAVHEGRAASAWRNGVIAATLIVRATGIDGTLRAARTISPTKRRAGDSGRRVPRGAMAGALARVTDKASR